MSNIIKSSYVVQPTTRNNIKVLNRRQEVTLEEEILSDAKKEYERIIKEAKAEATEIIEEAKVQSEEYIEDAYSKSTKIIKEARQNGYQEGYNEGKKISDELIKEANQYKNQYYIQREEILKETEGDVVTLVLDICDKVFNDFVENNKESVLSIISKGINSLNGREKLVIRVSIEDYDFVEMYKDRILVMANLVEEIEIKADNSLNSGGCVIETSKGNVDASMETQLNEIRKLLKDLLNSE